MLGEQAHDVALRDDEGDAAARVKDSHAVHGVLARRRKRVRQQIAQRRAKHRAELQADVVAAVRHLQESLARS